MEPTKILMVCLGNICRSPLAEGILKSKIKDQNIIIDSAGTGASHAGKSPDLRSIEIAKKHGIDITDQRARRIKRSDLDTFDSIIVMDEFNYRNLLMMAKSNAQMAKISMIMKAVYRKEDISVPDPYYGKDEDFEHVYKMLDIACDAIIKKISK